MKGRFHLLLFFVIVLISLGYASAIENIQLHQNWEFSEASDKHWLPAQVPGTVHQDLMRHSKLPNPFRGTNEKEIQWVEEKDWEYRTLFTLTQEQLRYDAIQLIFEGLDTYADVYLNGSLILRADNMFIGYTLNVKPIVHPGENRLHIYFHSPIKQTLPQWESTGFNYPADNDHHEKKLSVYTRKAPYSYGWDWGIRMVTSGIWRPVMLRLFNTAIIEDVHHRQLSLNEEKAELQHTVQVQNVTNSAQDVEITLRYSLDGRVVAGEHKSIKLLPGTSEVEIPTEIKKPQLWMPHGWGKPVLYLQEVILHQEGKEIARYQQKIGLRTVRLVNEEDQWGQSFYFEVNGVPLYAKGANYIPSDALLPSVTPDRYRQLFENIVRGNMNMIRVWGGGTYEDNLFYELADEHGILIWQDFMFGCTTYPHDPAFLSRVEKEAVYNIKRLRNHASLAIWCGNNEILEGMHYWGWKERYTEQVYQEMFRGYDRLFCDLLPSAVAKYDGGRSYIHGSPLTSNWGRPESWPRGDSHNWGVWYGRKPFESFDTDLGRFMSEFGFQSFPEMKTIASFADSADYAIESDVMNAHQKSSIGNSLIRTYMERDYILPENFEDFVYIGLVLQGRGMRYGFEAQRRNRPYCMGTLYWQLNDSWPVVSWSSVDYYNNWKALHYHTAKAFAPLLISPVQRNDSLLVYLVNDYPEELQDMTLELQWTSFSGKRICMLRLPLDIPANSSVVAFRDAMTTTLTAEQRRTSYLKMHLKDKKGEILTGDVYFFNKTRDLNLPKPSFHIKLKEIAGGDYQLTLKSPQLAKDVFVEVPVHGTRFSDNFFDLLPGETKVIFISTPDKKKINEAMIKINHIRATYP
ncbi:MAG: glycoside hydrolase family 2 protein [Paludibacter sp.]|nr:glycoside hydrolase family 2 protein [Paludibacter sp.]MDD4199478.1 glycoside hydrolase family 2 protein [Paludibacter sp.]MDD4427172.1 glycoside hydrolase family 2 protein [Paludibacter sp.]